MWWAIGALVGFYLLRRSDAAKTQTPTTTTAFLGGAQWSDRAMTRRMLPPEAAPGVDSLNFFAPDYGPGAGELKFTTPDVAGAPPAPPPGGFGGGAGGGGGGGAGGGGGGTGGGRRQLE